MPYSCHEFACSVATIGGDKASQTKTTTKQNGVLKCVKLKCRNTKWAFERMKKTDSVSKFYGRKTLEWAISPSILRTIKPPKT